MPKSVSVAYEFTQDERILDAFKLSVNQTMREIESEIKTRVRKQGANENRTTGNMIWAEFVHFTARPVNGIPDPHLHAHCYTFNTTWDDEEKKWKAGQFRDLKADAPYFEAAFHARFSRQLAELGYRIERTAKGWELAGVPQRVLDEFSKRTEQVEQKAKELGITSAKGKDGLAALTRERKQKQFTKPELRELWNERISAEERAGIQNNLRNQVSDRAKDFGNEGDGFCHAALLRARLHRHGQGTAPARAALRHWATWTWHKPNASFCGMNLSRKTWTVGNGSPPRMCWRKKSG